MIYVVGQPISGEDRRGRGWRDQLVGACRGWAGGPTLSLDFAVRRTRRLDLTV